MANDSRPGLVGKQQREQNSPHQHAPVSSAGSLARRVICFCHSPGQCFSPLSKNRIKVCLSRTSDVAHIRLRSVSKEPCHVYTSYSATSVPINGSGKTLT